MFLFYSAYIDAYGNNRYYSMVIIKNFPITYGNYVRLNSYIVEEYKKRQKLRDYLRKRRLEIYTRLLYSLRIKLVLYTIALIMSNCNVILRLG